MLIISIRLASTLPTGQPPSVIQQVLYPYLPGNVELYDMPFDMTDENGERKYQAQVRRLVKDLTSGKLSG